MAKILGLDVGSHTVKAVLMDSSSRAPTVERYAEVLRPPEGARMDTLRAALVELITDNPMHLDQVIVALPGPSLATHTLSMPFTDGKRIDAALPFEVESQLPFDLGEAVFDYQVTSKTDAKSDLMVGVMRKEDLQALLSLLAELQLDAKVVTHPAMAYQSLWLAQPEAFSAPEAGPIAILDIGHERTSLAIGTPGGDLEFARTFAGGGKDLTRALSTELQVTLPEANHWKEHQAGIGTEGEGPDGERVSAALVRGLQPILRELRPSLKAYTAKTRRAVSRIYLCGGTAQLRGLFEQLTRELDIPTEPLALATAFDAIPPGRGLAATQALALAFRGQLPGPRAPRFNLRRGEFAFKGGMDYLRVHMGRLAAFTSVLVALSILFLLVRNSVLSHREDEVDAQLCSATQKVLGHCEKNYERAINMLKGKENPSSSVPKISAMNFLAEMTQRIPSDVPVTFDEILVDPERLSLRGSTDASKQVDRISQALRTFRCFKEVKIGKLEKTKGDHVNFQLDILVDCPDAIPTTAAG